MTVAPSLKQMQEAGFTVGGEPLVALDLADTLMTAVDPAIDLWSSPERLEQWWDLQAGRLPAGPRPDHMAVVRLRASVREVLDAQVAGRPAQSVAVDDINAASSAVPTSLRLVLAPDGQLTAQTRWHTEYGGHPTLAHIAREVITLLSDAKTLQRLRRCANPECSMLFLALNNRRRWCADNICGNRARVAKHYARTHAGRQAS